MAVHQIIQRQYVNASLPEVWSFFSHAANLQKITPDFMNFRVTSGDLPEEIYPGQIITYKVSPFMNIPLFWMTEIRQVVSRKMFIDEQRRGPFRMWHHQHHFEESNGGVQMTDIVHYELPLWFMGELARILFVNRQLRDIFEYRRKKVESLFPIR